MPSKPRHRVQVVGNGGGWKCQIKTTDQALLEVWPSMPTAPVILGTLVKNAERYELVTDRQTLVGKTMIAVATEAWISFAKTQGLKRITINQYPRNPREVFVDLPTEP
jgi:hypothetical protein